MKKIVIASVLGLLSVSLADARGFFGRCGSCPVRREVCEPTPPVCTKTIMVVQVVKVPKCITVPAQKIVTPVADVIERIPQSVTVKIPNPVTYRYETRCLPDKIVRHPQPPCIRYQCPADCD